MADWPAGTKTCPSCDRGNGEQNGPDRLGSFDKEPALHAKNSLKGFEEQEIARPAK
jgi:hypothetical protein